MNHDRHDFLDFGASKGGSMKWAAAIFGGVGLGLERSRRKFALLQAAGLDAILGSALEADFPDKAFRYSIMIDFLEHLAGPDEARQAIEVAARVCRDFIFIHGPNFEAPDYLGSHGLKRYYADWHGHKWHHRVDELRAMIAGLGLKGCVVEREPIRDSVDRNLIPMEAPIDSKAYDSAIHAPKRPVTFDRPLYNRLLCIVTLSDDADATELLCRASGFRYSSI